MNQEQPFPEDDVAAARRARIERKLKQLQPRPVRFDAEAILDSALGQQPQAPPPAVRMSNQETRSRRWLTIAASWTCGAVAGALLMSLWLLPRGSDDPPTKPETLANNAASPELDASFHAGRDQPHNESLDRAEISDDDRRRPEIPQQSEDQWLTSMPMFDLRHPQSFSEGPLMGGDYTLRSNLSITGIEKTGSDQPGDSMRSLDAIEPLLEETSRPPFTVNPDQLLEELLGTRPGWRL